MRHQLTLFNAITTTPLKTTFFMSLENSVFQSPQNVPKVGNFVAKNCQKSEFSLFRKWHFRTDRSAGCLVAEKYRVIDRGG